MSNRTNKRRSRLGAVIAATTIFGLSTGYVYSVEPVVVEPPSIGSLKGIEPAAVPGIEKYIKNKNAAIKLGKALFWDMQTGSEGQSCGSCHFSAGADPRDRNQLSPGLNHTDPSKREIFNSTKSGGSGGPNYTLTLDDYPFTQFADPKDRNSNIEFETDDVTSSQGIFGSKFNGLNIVKEYNDFTDGIENCEKVADIFHVANVGARKVEPRNTPTMINAIFNFRNFWDGRANNVFNGVDPFGRRNKDARVVYYNQLTHSTSLEEVNLINSSAASQAVGPPLSDFEMSCGGKSFKQLGRKMLKLKPLALQEVDPTDSVLGSSAVLGGKGLMVDYRKLIIDAFQDGYWKSPYKSDDGYNQFEMNFSLFWGLAIQMYESTLISDDSRFDRFMDGASYELTSAEQAGMGIFLGKGKCANCHSGPEFTKAATHLVPENEEDGLVERMLMGNQLPAAYDNGFYNIGVRPTEEDLGVGADGPFGHPLSFTRQAQVVAGGGNAPDDFEVDPDTFEVNPGVPLTAYEPNAVDGAFKVPGLRNVELTAPYMHNGGMATLEQVVEFYNRGGNRQGTDTHNTSGFGSHDSNLDPDINSLELSYEEQANLVAFLKSLTDDRVRWEAAPFDRPQIFVAVGHPDDENSASDRGDGLAVDEWLEIPRVGAQGRTAKNLPALVGFLEEAEDLSPDAVDDNATTKRFKTITLRVLDNDVSNGAAIDAKTVIATNLPASTNAAITVRNDGTISYFAKRKGTFTFNYTVNDTNGNTSNVATVTVTVN